MKLCVSLYGETLDELSKKILKAISKGVELIEVRLDYLRKIDEREISHILGPFSDKLILTLRPAEEGGKYTGSNEERLKILTEVTEELSPKYVDVELRSADKSLTNSLRIKNSQVIVSWHDYANTPEIADLNAIVEKCLSLGDIAKVVCFSRSPADNLKILTLYHYYPPDRLIAFCMGEEGKVTRVLSLIAGAPFTYVSLGDERTAPGQLMLEEAQNIISWANRRGRN